ncbi:MAG: type II secretion system F family protein [Chloroflexi bacterium]|nr:type II secretion system F family protein [Chloroflexota bacterium]
MNDPFGLPDLGWLADPAARAAAWAVLVERLGRFDPTAVRPGGLLWPALVGLGLYLLLVAQPIGRPKPDLVERLRRLDVDERVRWELGAERLPLFRSRLLEALLRPVLDDVGALLRSLLGRLGLAGGRDLEARLAVARPGVTASQHYGEKLAVALVAGAFVPLGASLGVLPFGWATPWIAALVAGLGFAAPDWELERRLRTLRAACAHELPALVDLLAIATSAGYAVEQGLELVVREGTGAAARELRRATREAALGQAPLVEALEAAARRVGAPELSQLVTTLRAAQEQGLPLGPALAAQAEVLRDRRRLAVLEEGGKANVRMVIPVAVFILPVLFIILLVPAAVSLLGFGG